MLIANMAKTEGRTPAEVRTTLEERNPTGRLGEIEEFGFACAWMCSARSSYLTGQNILIDGGMFNSTLKCEQVCAASFVDIDQPDVPPLDRHGNLAMLQA